MCTSISSFGYNTFIFVIQVAYDLQISTMHLKFNLTGIRTHDLQIMDNTYYRQNSEANLST